MLTSSPLLSSGYALDMSPKAFGELRSSIDLLGQVELLRQNLAEDGYLYLPGFFHRADVLAVRDEFLCRLASCRALHPEYPIFEGIASDLPAKVMRDDIMSGNSSVRNLVFSPQLMSFYESLLGGKATHYDHIWTRLIRPGKGTLPHCDLPFMGRGTHHVMTAWIPYRDTSLEMGGLIVLEKSHLQAERIHNYLKLDADAYCENRNAYRFPGHLSRNPISLREKFGGRWLTSEFKAGDLLTFGMKFVHASLDNQTSAYRISTDTRYQLASEPIDHRWVGDITEEWAAQHRIGMIC
ncbi:hypothetical protein BH09VER1_BH09VER1_39380 [soil metagenome]